MWKCNRLLKNRFFSDQNIFKIFDCDRSRNIILTVKDGRVLTIFRDCMSYEGVGELAVNEGTTNAKECEYIAG